MPIDELLKNDLIQGEGQHIEFKSPNVDLRQHGDGVAKAIRATIAFLSTPGREPSRIYFGVVEGKDVAQLVERVFKAVEYRRKLSGAPMNLTPTEKKTWAEWVAKEAVQQANQMVVALDRPEFLGCKSEAYVAGYMKESITWGPNQPKVKLDWVNAGKPEPDATHDRQVLRVTVPPTGRDPRSIIATRDMGSSEGIKDGYGYLRYDASALEVLPAIAEDLREIRRGRRWAWWAFLVCTLFAVNSVVMCSRRKPPSPELVRRIDGATLRIDWSDIKAVDVTELGGGVKLFDDQVAAINKYLWVLRRKIQRKIYRVGSIDTTTPPNPETVDTREMVQWFATRGDNDTGEGYLQLSVSPYSNKGPWVIRGSGFVKEHKGRMKTTTNYGVPLSHLSQ